MVVAFCLLCIGCVALLPFVVCCLLGIDCCSLGVFVVWFPLFIVYLVVVRGLLLDAYCSMCVARCSLFVCYCLSCLVRCSLVVVHGVLFVVCRRCWRLLFCFCSVVLALRCSLCRVVCFVLVVVFRAFFFVY